MTLSFLTKTPLLQACICSMAANTNRMTSPTSFNGSIQLTTKYSLVITEGLSLEGTYGDLVQPPFSSRFPRTISRELLNISKNEDSTSPDNLCQQLNHPQSKNVFPDTHSDPLCFSLCPLPLLHTSEKRLPLPFLAPSLQVLHNTLMRSP